VTRNKARRDASVRNLSALCDRRSAVGSLPGASGLCCSVKVMRPRSDRGACAGSPTRASVMFSDSLGRRGGPGRRCKAEGLRAERIELGWAEAPYVHSANAYGSTAPRAAVPGPCAPPPPSTVPQHLLEKLHPCWPELPHPAAPQPAPEPIEPHVQPQAKVPATTTASASNQLTSATASTPSATLPASAAPGT